jgi:hypothetical protein
MVEHGGLMTRAGSADVSGMEPNTPGVKRPRGYQNLMLTAIAGAMVIGLVDRSTTALSPAPALAQADQPDGGGLMNALEQRKQIIAELRLLNSKIDRVEARLNNGLSVKVTEMPPLKLPPEPRPRQSDAKDAPGEGVTPAGVRPAGADAGSK